MNCVKCGREIEHDQVFCRLCLDEMENYPVKPGTVVHIPKHPEDEAEKKPPVRKKAVLPPEEQIRKLKRKVLGLRIGLALMLLLCGLLCVAISHVATELDFYRFLGQNYSTVGTPSTAPAASASTESPTWTRWFPEITEP